MSHSFFSVGWLSSHERHCSSVRPPALLKVPSSASLSSPRKSPLSMSMLKSATETQDMTQSIQHMLPAVLLYTEGIWLPQPTPQATEPTCQQTGDEWSDQTGRRQEGVVTDLNVSVVLIETDVRRASVSFTSVAVLLSSHTDPGWMDLEVFPFESLVSPELCLTFSCLNYRHFNLFQSVAEEALTV